MWVQCRRTNMTTNEHDDVIERNDDAMVARCCLFDPSRSRNGVLKTGDGGQKRVGASPRICYTSIWCGEGVASSARHVETVTNPTSPAAVRQQQNLSVHSCSLSLVPNCSTAGQIAPSPAEERRPFARFPASSAHVCLQCAQCCSSSRSSL